MPQRRVSNLSNCFWISVYRLTHSSSCFSSRSKTSATFILPSLTRPISSTKLIFRSVTVVTSTKITATTGLIFFDRHIRITKSYKLYFFAFLGKNCAFFGFTGGSFWFVKTGKCFTSVFYSTRGKSLNICCRRHNYS